MSYRLISVIVASILNFKTGHCETTLEPSRLPCNYFIDGLVSDVELSTNSEIGSTILELMLSPLPGGTHKRRRRGLNEGDLNLVTESSYFTLTFLGGSWALQIQDCLISGLDETLVFSMDYNHAPDDCQNSTLEITVVPTLPVWTTTESEVVDIGSCHLDGTIDVLTVQFSNSNPCVSFKCTVNCTNADKLFWIHADTVVRTYAEDITVSFTYILHTVCQDASDVGNQIHEKPEQFTDVIFTNNIPCTATVSSTTVTTISSSQKILESQEMTPTVSVNTQPSPINLTQGSSPRLASSATETSIRYFTASIVSSAPTITLTDKQRAKGFFQKPLNVAIVSAVGGTGVVAVAGVLSIVIGSRLCNLLSKGTSDSNMVEEQEQENNVNSP